MPIFGPAGGSWDSEWEDAQDMGIVAGCVFGIPGVVHRAISHRRLLHRRSERAGGEDRASGGPSGSATPPRWTTRSPSRSSRTRRGATPTRRCASIQPGGPYFKWPWERIHKVSIATADGRTWRSTPKTRSANQGGTVLEAVTKDQLNTGLTGQIRYRVVRAQPVRLPVRREEPDRARDGLLRLGPARAHRQLRGAARRCRRPPTARPPPRMRPS